MNRQEIINQIAEATGQPKARVDEFLVSFIDTVQSVVASGDHVSIDDFGRFDTSTRAQRNGRNPYTGAAMTIPQSVRPRFRPGKHFKHLVSVASVDQQE